MNTTNIIETKLIEIISSAQAVGADVYAVVQREAPELAREVVLSVGIEAASYVVIWTGVTLVTGIIFLKALKKYDNDADQPPVMLSGTLFVISLLIALLVTLSQGPDILKSIFTPRVVFMQEISKLIKR